MAIFDDDDLEFGAIYAEESAMVDASELIAQALVKNGMSRTELARALGISKSEITARLTGERNITVRNLARTLHALGHHLDLRISDRTRAAAPTGSQIAHLAAFRTRCEQKSQAIRPTADQVRRAVGSAR